jgi:YhgE/Pip-like protein
MRANLRHPFAWLAVGGGTILFFVMTFSYLGAFIDPVGNLKGLPILLVNQDRPVEALGQRVDAGTQAIDAIRGTRDARVKWKVVRSRAEAVRMLRNNEAGGAVVFGPEFSRQVVDLGLALATGAKPQPSRAVEVLRNPGGGLFVSTVFDVVSTEIRTKVVTEVNRQLDEQLTAANVKIAPSDATVLGNPVVPRTQDVVVLTEKSGRGIAPFYFAIMVALGAFIGTMLVSINIDALRGDENVEVLGRRLPLPRRHTGPWQTWLSKEILALPIMLVGPWLAVLMAAGILDMQVSSAWKLGVFSTLAALAVSQITLVFVTLLGIAGELVGVLFLTIFGVPSALGVYPQQSIPGIFRFVSSWHPLRYFSDGSRAIAFFDARADAGLGTAVWVLAAWAVGAFVAGLVCARLEQRHVERIESFEEAKADAEAAARVPGHGGPTPAPTS